MILGMNPFEFSIAAWLWIIALAWWFDSGPEIYRQRMAEWRKNHPKRVFDPEMTMELPRPKGAHRHRTRT